MKLTDVLKKTQNKAIDNSIKRTPPSIAYKERPYKLQNESNLKLNGKEERIYNREQSGSKLEANREQSGSKLEANREQSGSKVGAKPRAKKTGFSPLSKIIGQQKTLLILLYQECKKARMENTEALTLEYISDYTQIGKSVIKNTLQRLENKNCIMRKEYKNGRGGWTKYALRDDIFHDLLRLEKDHQLDKNNEQIDNKVGAKPRADSSLSSSISSNLVTTREEFKKFLPENWEHIETDDLSKIGFTREHLLQLCKNENLNPEIVQESINAFAFDLEENGKADRIKGSPLGYFMGILRKGLPYFPPENYEPPETRALRQYIEHKERQKTAKEELENRKFELELDEWIEKLSEEEIYQMIEEPRYRAKDSPFRRGFLSKHFKNNIYNKNGQL